jgi:hypothetical protein
MPKKHTKRASHKADVAANLVRLKGKSRADLKRDDRRGPGSPLGSGMKKEKKQ